jgi:hypothetical protein
MGTPCPSARAGAKRKRKEAKNRRDSAPGRTARRDREQAERLGIERIGGNQERSATAARFHYEREQRPAPLGRASQPSVHETRARARKRRKTVHADFDESRLRPTPRRKGKTAGSGQRACRRQRPHDAAKLRRKRYKKRQRGNRNTDEEQALKHPGRAQDDTWNRRRIRAPRSKKRVATGRRSMLRRRGRGVARSDHVRAVKP